MRDGVCAWSGSVWSACTDVMRCRRDEWLHQAPQPSVCLSFFLSAYTLSQKHLKTCEGGPLSCCDSLWRANMGVRGYVTSIIPSNTNTGAEARAAMILSGLSFTSGMMNCATKTFSGGWWVVAVVVAKLYIWFVHVRTQTLPACMACMACTHACKSVNMRTKNTHTYIKHSQSRTHALIHARTHTDTHKHAQTHVHVQEDACCARTCPVCGAGPSAARRECLKHCTDALFQF